MPSDTHRRGVNILAKLQTNTFKLDLYQPGTLEASNLVAGFKYTGQVTELRLTCKVERTNTLILGLAAGNPEVFYPIATSIPLLADTTEIDLLALLTKNDRFRLSPYTRLQILLDQPGFVGFNDRITIAGFAEEEGTGTPAPPATPSTWGGITGNLPDQIDLFTQLEERAPLLHDHDDRYLTDAELNDLIDLKIAQALTPPP